MLLSLQEAERIALGSTSTIPLQVMTSTESLRVNGFERNTGLWYLLKHNWRQFTSLVPGLMLLCATGNLHTSWTVWQLLLYVYGFEEVKINIILAWFVGVAGGMMLGALLNSNWSKICIYYSLAVALLPVSITFVVHQTSTYNMLLIGRVMAGILYGCTLITLLLHIADNSSQFMRRYFIWTISIVSIVPSVLLAEFISTATSICDVNATIGVLMFVFAIFTLIFMPCTYESIVFLLENGNDLRALEILLKLRNESRHYIRRDFNEFKMMLTEDYADDGSICQNGSVRPLFLLLLMRLLNTLLANSYIYWIFLVNIVIDYRNWIKSAMNTGSKAYMSVVQENFDSNQTTTSVPEQTTLFLENSSSIDYDDGTQNSTVFENITDFLYDTTTALLSINQITWNDTDSMESSTLTEFNETIDGSTESEIKSAALISDQTSYADHFFMHPSHSHHFTDLPIYQFLLIVFLVKIVSGIPLMCIAEKFKIYRNRTILKTLLGISILNLTFFCITMICYRIDDGSLIFTFYLAKLLTIIYCLYLLITFCIDTVSYCELAESFSLAKRNAAIAFILIGEYLLHALFVLLILSGEFKFYFHAIQSMVITIICYLLMRFIPNECLDQTLRAARDKYFVKKIASTN